MKPARALAAITPVRARLLAIVCACLVTVLSPPRASAQIMLPEASRTLEYETPTPKNYLRAALEELALISLGLGYYFVQQRQNSEDWALTYDWLSFRQKLTCQACAFDQNHFDTNFVTHPAAGLLYYIAARGNRLSVYESFGYAFGMSTLWEYLGEFRERVSFNDLLVTPIAGAALGESTTQLGAFFDRSCPTGLNRVLGSLFGPSRSVHDAIDEARPRRDHACDRHGLTTGGDHRFHVWLGGASVWGDRIAGTASEARLGIHTSVSHLDSIREPGSGWLGFSDGNISELNLRLAFEPEFVSDLRIGANAAPAGIHYRNLSGPRSSTSGHEVVLALLVGTEYSEHRRQRPNGPFDRVFYIEFPGALLAYTLRRRAATVELSLEAGTTFGGVGTYALPEYRVGHSDDTLPLVVPHSGYSDAFGVALAPRARLTLDGAELGFEARSDRFYGARFFDPVRPAHTLAPIYETRHRGEAWLAFGPSGAFPRARLFVDGYERIGTVGDARYSSYEVALGASIDAVF